IDTCTSIPELTRRLASEAAARGVRYVDAPLSGTTPAAEAGTLVVMAGGEGDVVEDCKPIYDAIGSKTVHCGPTGNGHAMKLVINSVLLVTQLAGYEGMALGVKLGLDADQIYDVLRSGAADSYINRFKLDKALRRDFSTAGSVGICIKDLDLANAMARGANIPLLLAPIAQQPYMAAKQAGFNEEDSAALIKLYERMLHIEVRGRGSQQ
ncbi:MAG: NAD(P)-dependent oxidoreductase, partial [Chloroflexi bacterium]|nr:NAD(P)-dependent oxidoreductase [Chloroflexota bacterium]